MRVAVNSKSGRAGGVVVSGRAEIPAGRYTTALLALLHNRLRRGMNGAEQRATRRTQPIHGGSRDEQESQEWLKESDKNARCHCELNFAVGVKHSD